MGGGLMGSWSRSFLDHCFFWLLHRIFRLWGVSFQLWGAFFRPWGAFLAEVITSYIVFWIFLSPFAMKGSVSFAGFGAISAPNGFSLLTRGSSAAYCAMIYIHSACTIKIHIYTNTYS